MGKWGNDDSKLKPFFLAAISSEFSLASGFCFSEGITGVGCHPLNSKPVLLNLFNDAGMNMAIHTTI